MEIVINTIHLLSPLTGVGIYTYQIAKHLQTINSGNNYTYFYGYYSKNLITYEENKGKFYTVKETVKNIPFLGSVARRFKGIINYITHKSFDLYFETNYIPMNIKTKRLVVTVFDFSFHEHPDWHPKDRVQYYNKYFWKNIERADRIIVISDYVKNSAVRFGLPEEKIKTIHLGFDREVFKTYTQEDLQPLRVKYSLPENFILFIGSVEPRKNLLNLIRAYITLDESLRNVFKLVLAGFKGWENKEIMQLLDAVKKDVVYVGYVPNDDLGKLYNLATVFAYPSFYEGFGLPPLEAMACGCPVITSNVTSLPEVCGDAARYVDPHRIENIAEGIHDVLTGEDLKQTLVRKGLERAKLFSWEKSATEHLKVFKEVLNS